MYVSGLLLPRSILADDTSHVAEISSVEGEVSASYGEA
jgi:hypothetical protein